MKLVNLLYDVENGTGIVQFNRPNVLNALNSEVLRELDGLMREIRNDPMVGVVILTGAERKGVRCRGGYSSP
jgi:enoyl-CoA hydratase/carnithine racemase